MLTVIKRAVCAAAAAAFCFTLAGCGKSEMSSMEKVQKKLTDMESYKSDATIKRTSNKGEMTYETVQYNKTSGEYRLEITGPEAMAGNFTVYDGTNVSQFNAKTNETVTLDVPEGQKGSQLFLCAFVKNYMQSEDVSVDTANLDESKCTVLEAVIPDGNKYIATEKLWMDNDTLVPLKLVIYDENGGERYVITYNNFEYNPKMDDSIFTVQ